MILAIVGSRNFNDYEKMYEELKDYKIEKIISGGAKGADALGKKYSIENNIEYEEFPAKWDLFGKSAGMIRNKRIVDSCEKLIAFWDVTSKGTLYSVNLATKQNKLLKLVYF